MSSIMREDWIEVELGEAFNITYGKGLSTKDLLKEGYPVYGANGVIGFYSDYKYEERQVLISCRGAASGKINISPEKCFITNNSLIVESSSDFISKEYLYFILSGANRSKIVTGSAQPQVTINNAKPLIIKLAPLPIQRAIVSKIEALFSDLDNGIANFKKAQEQLKIYRQAVLKKAFQGGLSNILRTDELPLGWIEGELGNIISISSGKGLTKENREDDGVYFVYGGNGITGKHSEFLYENEKLIIGRVGVHCGNVHITKPKSWITDNAFVVSFDEDVFDLHFLHYFLTNLNLNKYASSTAQPVISQGKIYPIEISYPNTKEEQNQIVQEIESRLSVCDKMEQSINESIEKAEALRQSILKKAFEGKLLSQAEIEQCKQAADYEPASELLKKIQAEKLAKEQEKKKKPTDKKKSKK